MVSLPLCLPFSDRVKLLVMSLPLTPQVLNKSNITVLVQILAEDQDANVTMLDVAPLPDDRFGNRREQIRLGWQTPKVEEQRSLILAALPEQTWSEALNPSLPAPATVLFIESDLPTAINALKDGFVAGGRRHEERPAWTLREDWTAPSTITLAEIDTVLAQTAAFHALHWGAARVLDDVYPWLPRFETWARYHGQWAAMQLGVNFFVAPNTYVEWANRHLQSIVPYFQNLHQTLDSDTLQKLQHYCLNPTDLLAPLLALPQTLIHGDFRAEHLRLADDQLLVEGWDRLMVGPPAWDVYSLLDSLGVEDKGQYIEKYLGYLFTIVTELEDSERAAFAQIFRGENTLFTLLEPSSQ